MTPDEALKIVEAVREAARHGIADSAAGFMPTARDWARYVLEDAGQNYYPDEPLKLEPGTFPGIELRVSVNGQPLFQADSLRLYFIATLAGQTDDEWYDVFQPANGPFTATVVHVNASDVMVPIPMKIEIRPRMLTTPGEDEPEEEE